MPYSAEKEAQRSRSSTGPGSTKPSQITNCLRLIVVVVTEFHAWMTYKEKTFISHILEVGKGKVKGHILLQDNTREGISPAESTGETLMGQKG